MRYEDRIVPASGVFSNATRGAGIYMYWLMDEVALDLPKNKVDDEVGAMRAFRTYRDTAAERAAPTPLSLATDFMHLIFLDENGLDLGAASIDDNGTLNNRGTMIGMTDMHNYMTSPQGKAGGLNLGRFHEFVSTTVAHELTHFLFERKNVGAFNGGEHTTNANGNQTVRDANDQTCILYDGTTWPNVELATVQFFPVVQQELKVRRNQALVLNPYQ